MATFTYDRGFNKRLLGEDKQLVRVNGKRTGMVQRFVLMHERSIKELTRAADSSSSWQLLKTNRFGDANRRGSPSRIEGLGSSIGWGQGEVFPL